MRYILKVLTKKNGEQHEFIADYESMRGKFQL